MVRNMFVGRTRLTFSALMGSSFKQEDKVDSISSPSELGMVGDQLQVVLEQLFFVNFFFWLYRLKLDVKFPKIDQKWFGPPT